MSEIKYRRSSLGGGLVFMDDKDLWAEFTAAGMSLKAFRKWLKVLHVPTVHVGKCRLVRVQSFRLALLAISRVGRPDFLAPGCAALDGGYASKVGGKTDTELNVEEFEATMTELVAELLFAKAAAGGSIATNTVRLANETARAMLAHALHTAPLKAQALYDRENVKRMKKETGPLPFEVISECNREDRRGGPEQG